MHYHGTFEASPCDLTATQCLLVEDDDDPVVDHHFQVKDSWTAVLSCRRRPARSPGAYFYRFLAPSKPGGWEFEAEWRRVAL